MYYGLTCIAMIELLMFDHLGCIHTDLHQDRNSESVSRQIKTQLHPLTLQINLLLPPAKGIQLLLDSCKYHEYDRYKE